MSRSSALAALVALSLGTAPPARAQAPAGERDLAYERGVQAEAAGDHAAAAAAYERAYRLTAAGETGPRLLFLRAGVAAYLHGADGEATTRLQLCHAQSLLREYLAGTDAVSTEEHASLGRIDQRLSQNPGPDCAALLAPPVPADPPQPPQPRPQSQPQPRSPAAQPQPAPAPASPADREPRQRRALLAAGITSVALGVAGFAVMGRGVAVSREALALGDSKCLANDFACSTLDYAITELREDGDRGNRLTRVGAVIGGLALLAGIALIVVGERLHRHRRAALAPRVAPGELGLGLAGRF